MNLSLVAPAAGDPRPAEWDGKAILALHMRGTTSRVRDFERWAHEIANKAQGALYRHADRRFLRVWVSDRTAAVTQRAKRLFERGDAAQLAAWLIELSTTDDPPPFPRYQALDTIRTLAVPVLTADPAAWFSAIAALVAAPQVRPMDPLHGDDPYAHDRDVGEAYDDLIVAAAKLPEADATLVGKATLIRLAREEREDRTAILPETKEYLMQLLVASAEGDHRAKLRLERFSYRRDTTRRLIMRAAAGGWSPGPAVIELAAGYLPGSSLVRQRDVSVEETEVYDLIERAGFAASGTLAAAIHQGYVAWQDGAGGRTLERTSDALAFYEAHKDDPMVVQPRSHDSDIAMYRWLNTALWGRDRKGPRLPEAVIILICDRRFDAAHAAYLQHFPEERERVDSAIADARQFFADEVG